jgi:hypothetical protein
MACRRWLRMARQCCCAHAAHTLATEDPRLDQRARLLADRTGAAVFGEAHNGRQSSWCVSVRCHLQNASTAVELQRGMTLVVAKTGGARV